MCICTAPAPLHRTCTASAPHLHRTCAAATPHLHRTRQENLLHGRYFAELTRELFDNLEESKYQNSEYRLSVFGVERGEWDRLAAWVGDHQLYSQNNRWIVQVPRLYGLYHAKGKVATFEQMLGNIFLPLFEAAAEPASHPKLHLFLQQAAARRHCLILSHRM